METAAPPRPPYISKLTLRNWKSFDEAVLYFDPLSILIGLNASGKSNALDALEFLKRTLKYDLKTALDGDEYIPSLRGGSDWAARRGQESFTIEVRVTDEKKKENYIYLLSIGLKDKIIIAEESLILINNSGEQLKLFYLKNSNKLSNIDYFVADNYTYYSIQNLQTVLKSSTESHLFNIAKKNINDPNFEINNENRIAVSNTMLSIDGFDIVKCAIENIIILNINPEKIRENSKPEGFIKNDASNLAGFISALPEDEKEKLETKLQYYLSQMPEKDITKVWAEKIGRLGKEATIYAYEKFGEEEMLIDASSMSDGTLRFLAILTAILTRPAGSLLVIEEIDNGFHPSRCKLLLDVLRKEGEERKVDVLLTTHNAALLDALEPSEYELVQVVYRDAETGHSRIMALNEMDDYIRLISSGSLGTITANGRLEKSLSKSK